MNYKEVNLGYWCLDNMLNDTKLNLEKILSK